MPDIDPYLLGFGYYVKRNKETPAGRDTLVRYLRVLMESVVLISDNVPESTQDFTRGQIDAYLSAFGF